MHHHHIFWSVFRWLLGIIFFYTTVAHTVYRIFELRNITFLDPRAHYDNREHLEHLERTQRAMFWPIWLLIEMGVLGFKLTNRLFTFIFGTVPRYFFTKFPRDVQLLFQKKQPMPEKGPFRTGSKGNPDAKPKA